ncbi:ABC transporter ATP-binding protein [Thermodesulfobacteriota bacterium]
MSNIAIKVERLSKRYRIGLKEEMHDTLFGAMTSWLKFPLSNLRQLQKLSHFDDQPEASIVGDGQSANLNNQEQITNNSSQSDDIIWALKDVSFEVKHGEVLGIIGRNGAGKSTLLKILSRITEPSSGKVIINGHVSSLLEVGTGFHPELTGRENIYLNGTILGMSKTEIDRKFDEIVAFSEVEKFLDTPVKRYSSGMRVRLAFAVAAHLEPEILIIDEVLAVGDSQFQKKCLGKMKDVGKEGRTVLFVSHNMSAINSLCSTSIVLHDGKQIYSGATHESIDYYLNSVSSFGKPGNKRSLFVEFNDDVSKPIQFNKISMHDESGKVNNAFLYDGSAKLKLILDIKEKRNDYYSLVSVYDKNKNIVFCTADDDLYISKLSGLVPGNYSYSINLPKKLLKPGEYYITASLTQKNRIGEPFDRRDSVYAFSIIDNKSFRAANNGYRELAIVAPEIEWELDTINTEQTAHNKNITK